MTLNRCYKRVWLILIIIIGVILLVSPVMAESLGAFIDAKLIGQISGDNLVIQQNINNGVLIIRGGVDNSGGSVMDASFIIMFAAVAIMACGFVFKKSWLLWLAIPFFVLFSLYWAYLETWFPPLAQHSLLLIGVGAAFGLGFSAIRMQAKPTTARSELDEDMDEEDTEFQMQMAPETKHNIRFTNAGHSAVYNEIPDGEIWINQDLCQVERKFYIYHEMLEMGKMLMGLNYDTAHVMANKAEGRLRHMGDMKEVDRLIKKMLILNKDIIAQKSVFNGGMALHKDGATHHQHHHSRHHTDGIKKQVLRTVRE